MLYNYHYVLDQNGLYQIERYGMKTNATVMTVSDELTAQKIVAALIRETNEMSGDARNEAVNDIRRTIWDHLHNDYPDMIPADRYQNVSILTFLVKVQDLLKTR